MTDWVAWHEAYDDPASSLSARLERVRWHLARAIDRAPAGRVQLVSLCAGQGHDVLGVLPGHPRRPDVSAVLVELDATNAALARQRAAAAGLTAVEVRERDAGLVANYADALPADVLLLSGIFGNVTEADIMRTIRSAGLLCADGATVIWSRHRRPPDITGAMRESFAASGFDEVAFEALDNEFRTGVGVHRLARRPAGSAPAAAAPGHPAGRLFSFGSARR